MNKILLIGGGGHCKVIINEIQKNNLFSIEGIIDLKENIGQRVLNIPIINDDDALNFYYKQEIKYVFISLGSIGNPIKRNQLFELCLKIGFDLPNIISDDAIISDKVNLGRGIYIGPGCIVNCDTLIDDNCILNSGAIIEHDVKIGKSVHVSPGSIVCGNVTIGDNSHIGAGSTLIQKVCVGTNTIIGAGSIVVRNIPDNVIAFGSPCQVIKNNHEK